MSHRADPWAGSDLLAFVVAVESGSIHGAADALSLTASAVTKRVQSLEARTGVRLLDRGRYGVRPTAAGKLLYPEAKQALTALQHAQDALADHRERAANDVRMAASHTLGEFLVPGWLAVLRASHPRVHAHVDIANSTNVIRAVRNRDVDIGFVEGLDPEDGLETTTVSHDEIVAVVAPDHPWAQRSTLKARELLDQPYLTREPGSGTRAVAEAALAEVGVSLVPFLEVASTQSVKRALESGGFALLSFLAIESEQRAGTLRTVPIQDARLRRRLRAVREPDVEFSGVTLAFWDWLKSLSESTNPDTAGLPRSYRRLSRQDVTHPQATSVADMVAEAKQHVDAITPAALAEEMACSPPTLIDLREQNERELDGIIASSVHAPRGMLELWADTSSASHRLEFERDARVILHCSGGARSALAALTLQQLGYERVAHLEGGFQAWKEAGLPVQPVEAAPEPRAEIQLAKPLRDGKQEGGVSYADQMRSTFRARSPS